MFRRKTIKKKASNKWTNFEYNQLITLVRVHGEQWIEISKKIPNKTAKQCM